MSLAGLTADQRQAKRDQYRVQALREADERERSLKCTWGKHSNIEDGCTCLCECHDT